MAVEDFYQVSILGTAIAGKVPSYHICDSKGELPLESINEGDFAFAKDERKAYIFRNSSWNQVITSNDFESFELSILSLHSKLDFLIGMLAESGILD